MEIIGCPLDIIDEVLKEREIINHYELYIRNCVLSETLKSIGLKLRFPQLEESKRKTIFTKQACFEHYSWIVSMKNEGYLNDYIAIKFLTEFENSWKDADVYLNGNKLFTK